MPSNDAVGKMKNSAGSEPSQPKRQRESSDRQSQSKGTKTSNSEPSRVNRRNDQHEPLRQTPTKSSTSNFKSKIEYDVAVSLDNGSEYFKVGIVCIKKIDGKPQPILPKDLETMIWPNGELAVRSHVAYKRTTVPRTGHAAFILLCGHEVDDALSKGEIQEKDIIRHVKPMIFQGQMAKEKEDDAVIASMMEEMNLDVEDITSSLDAVGERSVRLAGQQYKDPAEARVSHNAKDPLWLYAQLFRYGLRFALRYLAKHHKELKWPTFERDEDCDDFLKSHPEIRISLLVPASCTDELRGSIVAAAVNAGVQDPILVPEPAAALTHYVATKLENRVPMIGKRLVLVDTGAGSSDSSGGTVTDHPCSLVTEEIPGDTDWCGGSEVNASASTGLMEDMRSKFNLKKNILGPIQRTRNKNEPVAIKKRLQPYLPVQVLAREMRQGIEVSKRDPPNVAPRYLKISGLPYQRNTMLCGRDGIVITTEKLKQFYGPSTQRIIRLSVKALRKMFYPGHLSSHAALPVDEIIFCGGATSNTFVQEEIRKAIKQEIEKASLETPVAVNFVVTPGRSDGNSTVALGSLLLASNEQLLKKRMIGRKCFVLCGADPLEAKLTREIHVKYDKTWIAKFFTSDKDILNSQKLEMDAERFLLLDKQDDGNPVHDGWNVEDTIYYTKTLPGLHRKIKHGRKITEAELRTAGAVPFPYTLSKDQVSAMPRKHHRLNYVYYHVRYLLQIQFIGTDLVVVVKIPRSGELPPGNDAGTDPIVLPFRKKWEGACYPAGTSFGDSQEYDVNLGGESEDLIVQNCVEHEMLG